MQIREKGGRYYFLRSSYDPTKKRCIQSVVGGADSEGKISLHEGVELTLSERQEFHDFLAPRTAEKVVDDLSSLSENLEAFRGLLAAHPHAETLELAKAHAEGLKVTLKVVEKHLKRLAKRQPAEDSCVS